MSLKLNEEQEVKLENLTAEGTYINLRDKKLLVLPVLFKDLPKVIEMLAEVGSELGEINQENFKPDKAIGFVRWILSQSYPEITDKDVEEILSFKGFVQVYEVVLALNSIKEFLDSVKNVGLSSQTG